MTDYEPCLRSPDTSERCQLPYKHDGPCRFVEQIPKSEVARVLAGRLLKLDSERCRAIDASRHHDVDAAEEALDTIYGIVEALDLFPEFESALKALEKEQGRG